MPKKSLPKNPSSAARYNELLALKKRMGAMERDFQHMRDDMGVLSDDLVQLKHAVQQMDARTMRGERLMLEMQLDQRKMMAVVSKIADALHVSTAIKEPTSA